MRHIDKSLAKGLASQTLRQADARGEHAQDVVITHMSKIGMSARHQIRTMRRILEHTGPGLVSHRFEFPGRHFQAVFEFWNLGKSSIVKKEFEEHGLTTQYMTVGVRARSEVISEWPADSCFYISLHALQRVIMRGGLDTVRGARTPACLRRGAIWRSMCRRLRSCGSRGACPERSCAKTARGAEPASHGP